MIKAFIEFVDGIYCPRYAGQLSKDDPDKFTFELSEFVANYL